MTTYVFDPDAMRHYGGTVRRAGTGVRNAALQLLLVQTAGLPPEAQGRVESQCRSLWRMLSAGASSLEGGAGLVTRMASAVERADSPTMTVAGLSVARVTRAGAVILRDISDRAYGSKVALGDRAKRLVTVLNAITGQRAVDAALAYSSWRKAVNDAKVSGSKAKVISAGLRRHALNALDDAKELRGRANLPIPDELKNSRGKQWLNRAAGIIPGPAGDLADVVGYVAASEKLRADEPQTGVSQVATDVRDFVNLSAASAHLTADVMFKTPLTAPAGVVAEGAGFAMDGVTLGMDGISAAGKGLSSAAGTVKDGFTSLVGLG